MRMIANSKVSIEDGADRSGFLLNFLNFSPLHEGRSITMSEVLLCDEPPSSLDEAPAREATTTTTTTATTTTAPKRKRAASQSENKGSPPKKRGRPKGSTKAAQAAKKKQQEEPKKRNVWTKSMTIELVQAVKEKGKSWDLIYSEWKNQDDKKWLTSKDSLLKYWNSLAYETSIFHKWKPDKLHLPKGLSQEERKKRQEEHEKEQEKLKEKIEQAREIYMKIENGEILFNTMPDETGKELTPEEQLEKATLAMNEKAAQRKAAKAEKLKKVQEQAKKEEEVRTAMKQNLEGVRAQLEETKNLESKLVAALDKLLLIYAVKAQQKENSPILQGVIHSLSCPSADAASSTCGVTQNNTVEKITDVVSCQLCEEKGHTARQCPMLGSKDLGSSG